MADGDLSRTLKEFFSRFWARRRAAFSGGRGHYWLSMLLLAVGLLFVRAFFLPSQQSARETKALLRKEQEPSSTNHFPAVAAVLIGDNAQWTICDEEDPKGEGRGGTLPDEVFALFMERYFGDNSEPAQALEKDPRFADLQRLVSPDVSWTKPIDFNAPEPLKEAPNFATAPGMDKAVTSERQESALRLPSQLNPLALRPPSQQDAGVVGERLAQAITRSRSIEALRPFVGKPAVLKGDAADAPLFDGFFFFSVDGAVRTLEPMHSNLVAHRNFLSPSFVQEGLLQTRPQRCASRAYPDVRYHSQPYLDINGDGLLATLCYRVQSPGPPAGVTVGVLCIDISLPRRRVEASLEKSNLYHPVWVELRTRTPQQPGPGPHPAHAELESLRVCGQGGYEKCPFGAWDAGAALKAEAAARQWWQQVSERGSYYGAADLAVTGDGSIAASLHRDALTSSSDRYELAILLPASSSGWWGYLVLALLCVMGISSLFVRAAVQHDRQQEASLLRGLPFGVVRVDEGSHIVAANDRAEELLNRPLPKFGLADPTSRRSAEQAYLVTDILCSDKVYFRRGHGFTEGQVEELWERSERGLTDEYWVKLDTNSGRGEKGEWFRVIGSPILRTPGEVHAFIMFERVDPRTLAALPRDAAPKKE